MESEGAVAKQPGVGMEIPIRRTLLAADNNPKDRRFKNMKKVILSGVLVLSLATVGFAQRAGGRGMGGSTASRGGAVSPIGMSTKVGNPTAVMPDTGIGVPAAARPGPTAIERPSAHVGAGMSTRMPASTGTVVGSSTGVSASTGVVIGSSTGMPGRTTATVGSSTANAAGVSTNPHGGVPPDTKASEASPR
jgi:hypothetical protein